MPTWPYARLTTYVAGNAPEVKANDLNSVQDQIVNLTTLLNPTLPASGVDTPQTIYDDASGVARSQVSHLGFRRGAYHFEEQWLATLGANIAATSATSLASLPRWCAYISGNASISQLGAPLGSAFPYMRFNIGNAYPAVASLYAAGGGFIGAGSGSGAILVGEQTIKVVGNSGIQAYIGFDTPASQDPNGSIYYCRFFANQAGITNWLAQSYNSGANPQTAAVDCGVAAVPGTWQHFMIEYFDAVPGLFGGLPTARFFIDGILCATITGAVSPATSPLPNNQLTWLCAQRQPSGVDQAYLECGPVVVDWSRTL